MKRLFVTFIVCPLLSLLPVHSQKVLTQLEYWIDNDERKEATFTNNSISLTVDASDYSEGLHTLSYRVKDSDGMYSPLQTWVFLRIGETPEVPENWVSQVEYWLDDDVENRQSKTVDNNSISFSVDASGLNSGLHRLVYRVRDALGRYCAPKVWVFYKPEETTAETRKVAWLKYWWNDETDKAVTEPVTEESTTYVFSKDIVVPDYAKTDDETHTARFCYVVGDDAGNASPTMYTDVEYPDNQEPVTVIEADSEVASGSVVLKWHTVSDVAQDYNIYYSEAGGPYVLWLPNTTKTTATFKGQAGKTYRFTVTARDITGESESLDENKNVEVKFE